ncbi:hypothetical protein MKX01_033866 [Papaver californicum]|nr:hypothetical protein MKX01_033866 [Papaver californicum]
MEGSLMIRFVEEEESMKNVARMVQPRDAVLMGGNRGDDNVCYLQAWWKWNGLVGKLRPCFIFEIFYLGKEAPDKVLSRIYINLERLRLSGDEYATEIMKRLRIIVGMAQRVGCLEYNMLLVMIYLFTFKTQILPSNNSNVVSSFMVDSCFCKQMHLTLNLDHLATSGSPASGSYSEAQDHHKFAASGFWTKSKLSLP